MPIIRPYRESDLDAVRDVCVRTGYAGGDARPLIDDPDLLPDTFAVPYLVREPDLAFVVDDDGVAVGYILGTADTTAFVTWFREVWLPPLVERHPPLPGGWTTWPELIVALLHDPERMVVPEVADYPAHLHIDLLPGYQGQGLGRALMTTFLAALRDRGVARVHLSMDPANTGAAAFYERCGFHRVPVVSGALFYGRETS